MLPKIDNLDQSTKGFHGTTEHEAEEIIRTNFIPSARSTGACLGDGVYFFDHQPTQAQHWAKFHKGNKGTKIAVIESEVRYGRLLNLTDPEQFRHVTWFKEEYERKAQKRVTMPTIIDIVAEKLGAESVKATRVPNNMTRREMGFSPDVEIILAVRLLTNILSKKLIWRGMIGYV